MIRKSLLRFFKQEKRPVPFIMFTVETASDALDELQLKTERELATQNLNRDSSMLRHIDLALLRASIVYGMAPVRG
jgi:hypothetical protein